MDINAIRELVLGYDDLVSLVMWLILLLVEITILYSHRNCLNENHQSLLILFGVVFSVAVNAVFYFSMQLPPLVVLLEAVFYYYAAKSLCNPLNPPNNI